MIETNPAQGQGAFGPNPYWDAPDALFAGEPDHPALDWLRLHAPDVAARWDRSCST